MKTPKFEGPFKWGAFRRQLLSLQDDVQSIRKIAGKNVSKNEYPGKGTVINVTRQRGAAPASDCPPSMGPCSVSFTWATDEVSGSETNAPFDGLGSGGTYNCDWADFEWHTSNLPFGGVYQTLCTHGATSECDYIGGDGFPVHTHVEIHLWRHLTTGEWWMTLTLLWSGGSGSFGCTYYFDVGAPPPDPPLGVIPDDGRFLIYLGAADLDFSSPVAFSADIPVRAGSYVTCAPTFHIEGTLNPC